MESIRPGFFRDSHEILQGGMSKGDEIPNPPYGFVWLRFPKNGSQLNPLPLSLGNL